MVDGLGPPRLAMPIHTYLFAAVEIDTPPIRDMIARRLANSLVGATPPTADWRGRLPLRDSEGLKSTDTGGAQDSPRPITRLPLVRVGDAYDLVGDLPVASVDCVLTSPPYWGLRTYGLPHSDNILQKWRDRAADVAGDVSLSAGGPQLIPTYEWYRRNGGLLGMEPYPEWYVSHLLEILDRIRPTLKPRANVWVNLGDTYFARWSSIRDGRQGLGGNGRDRRRTPSGGWLHDKQLMLVPARFAIAMQDRGWILRNDLIWSKPDVPPRPEKDRLRLAHEHFFHFVQRSAVGRPTYHYDISEVEDGARDVVAVGVRAGRGGHSATFPPELIRPRIASSCPPGGLVLDPFCGTGRALEIAIELGRMAHGIELSPSHAQTARSHLRQARIAADQITPSTWREARAAGAKIPRP